MECGRVIQLHLTHSLTVSDRYRSAQSPDIKRQTCTVVWSPAKRDSHDCEITFWCLSTIAIKYHLVQSCETFNLRGYGSRVPGDSCKLKKMLYGLFNLKLYPNFYKCYFLCLITCLSFFVSWAQILQHICESSVRMTTFCYSVTAEMDYKAWGPFYATSITQLYFSFRVLTLNVYENTKLCYEVNNISAMVHTKSTKLN